jgi:hypothetical protein
MSEPKRIGPITLSSDGPTELTFADLSDWVIWQFPVAEGGWLCGAVHPPAAEYGWLPVRIHPGRKRIVLHAHRCEEPFATPEEASEWMAENQE